MRFAQCAWNARIVCDGCNNKCRDFHRTGQLISLQNIPPLTRSPYFIECKHHLPHLPFLSRLTPLQNNNTAKQSVLSYFRG